LKKKNRKGGLFLKTLYLDCSMGCAGDMLLSSLTALTSDGDSFLEKLNGLKIPNVEYKKTIAEKCGICGIHIDVSVNGKVEGENLNHHEHHEHHHSSLSDMEHIISHLNVSEKVRKNAISAFRLIAEAESAAHGKAVEEIHFHEVGTLDAVADVVGVCLAMEEIGAEKITASPVHVGSGFVKCAHGILPVPAPATAYILKNVPIYGGEIDGELCTPTGAALLKTFVSEFSDVMKIKVSKIGYGMGTKDFERANCLRAMLGETEEESDFVAELCCNIDDMTAEEIAFAANTILESGARDVFMSPIYMKKNRPGTLLHVICDENEKDKFVSLIFKHTSTLGVREYNCKRYVLEREEGEIDTEYGTVRTKKSFGYGVEREKAEYDCLEKIARERGISITEVKKNIQFSK
jgi:hypothetical protein